MKFCIAVERKASGGWWVELDPIPGENEGWHAETLSDVAVDLFGRMVRLAAEAEG